MNKANLPSAAPESGHSLPGSWRPVLSQLAGYASVLVVCVLLVAPFARAADSHEHAHHHHHHSEPAKSLNRSEASYALADLKLTRMDGSRVELAKELETGSPVVLNFIYTSCTAICPMTSQVFSRLQETLSASGEDVRLVSISIDPEHDTPVRLAAYARQFSAGPQWQFYTGTAKESIAIQKAFDTFRGDKMNHIPVTFLRRAPGKPWVRIEGMASPDDLVEAYRKLGAGA